MSDFALRRRFRGMKTILSSGPQLAEGGNLDAETSVISMPMIAKSPDSSSKMSGQLLRATVVAPLACGSGPSLRRNTGALIVTVQIIRSLGRIGKNKIPAIAG